MFHNKSGAKLYKKAIHPIIKQKNSNKDVYRTVRNNEIRQNYDCISTKFLFYYNKANGLGMNIPGHRHHILFPTRLFNTGLSLGTSNVLVHAYAIKCFKLWIFVLNFFVDS